MQLYTLRANAGMRLVRSRGIKTHARLATLHTRACSIDQETCEHTRPYRAYGPPIIWARGVNLHGMYVSIAVAGY